MEYALLIAGVAAAVLLAIVVFGGGVESLFDDTCESVAVRTSTDCD